MKDKSYFEPITKEAFLEYAEEKKLFGKNDKIIAAVSGGCDSSALLHLLVSIKDDMNLDIICAHVNHGIRGSEADRDEEYVKSIAEKYKVPFEVIHADIPLYSAEHHMSQEDAGRKIRYEFFESLSKKYGNALIATAHTLSDQAETYIFNTARGASLSGICGIPAKRGNIIRPLILFTREQTEDYCWQNDIDFVTDSTNLEDEYTRNKIRHHVIPVLKEINPSFEKAFGRLLSNLDSIREYEAREAQALIEKSEISDGIYDCHVFSASPQFIRSEIASCLLEKFGFEVTNERSLFLAQSFLDDQDFKKELSKDSFLIKSENLIFKKEKGKLSDIITPVPLQNGENRILPGKILVKNEVTKEEFENLHKVKMLSLKKTYDCDKITGVAVARSRNIGDRINVHGGYKTLKKLFNEEKIPPEQRNSIAVIADDIGPVFIEGLGSDIRCRVKDDTKHVAIIEIKNI